MNSKLIPMAITIVTACILGIAITVNAAENFDQCIQTCNDKFPIVATTIFPDNLTFEDTTDKGEGEYKGTAAVLFPAKWEGKIKTVLMNGEKAFHGESYKGRPVFRFKKAGNEYSKPLKFTIETTTGNYTYSIGSSGSSVFIPPKNSTRYKYFNIGDGGRRAYRVTKKGTDFGKSLKIVYDSGHVFNIPDTSKRTTDSKGCIYRPGTGVRVDPVKTQEQTSHGGVYLYGPYKDNSDFATFYYGE